MLNIVTELKPFKPPFVIMGIGLPGSGKTTLFSQISKLVPGLVVISPDSIRLRLTGNESDQSKNQQVWDTVHYVAKEVINKNGIPIIDATYAKQAERMCDIKIYKSMGANYVIGLYIHADFIVANNRNTNRNRTVPLGAMQRMDKMLQNSPPSLSDGFDKIIYFRSE